VAGSRAKFDLTALISRRGEDLNSKTRAQVCRDDAESLCLIYEGKDLFF
jgi:hypothetical protein